jgi:chaperonin GroES
VEAKGIMNIRPLYDRIVFKRVEEQESMFNGIVIPHSAKEKPREEEVLAVGHDKRLENGKLVASTSKPATASCFGKYSGNEIKLRGAEYIIMRGDDVLGILESSGQAANKST